MIMMLSRYLENYTMINRHQKLYPRLCSGFGCDKKESCLINDSSHLYLDPLRYSLYNIHLNDCMYYFDKSNRVGY